MKRIGSEVSPAHAELKTWHTFLQETEIERKSNQDSTTRATCWAFIPAFRTCGFSSGYWKPNWNLPTNLEPPHNPGFFFLAGYILGEKLY